MPIVTSVDGTWVNQTASYDAGELRRADGAAFAGDGIGSTMGGVVRHSDTSLAVSVDSSDTVTVQRGTVVIPGNAVTGTGPYRASIPSSVTCAVDPRNTNPRIDLVVFRQLDTDVVGTHGAYTARIEIITGTPAAVPAAPTLPSMAVELGRVTVPASGGAASSVDSSFRTYAAALGADLIVGSMSRLPASGATLQRARALDTGNRYEWTGSRWAQTSYRIGSTSVTTNASGQAVISHGGSETPMLILAKVATSQTYVAFATNESASSFTATVKVLSTGAVATGNFTIHWTAYWG